MYYHWQDIVLTICIFVFNLALIPSVLGKSKPEVSTSIVTATFLTLTVVVYISLSLWFSATMQAINASLWTALAIQKMKQTKLKKHKR